MGLLPDKSNRNRYILNHAEPIDAIDATVSIDDLVSSSQVLVRKTQFAVINQNELT